MSIFWSINGIKKFSYVVKRGNSVLVFGTVLTSDDNAALNVNIANLTSGDTIAVNATDNAGRTSFVSANELCPVPAVPVAAEIDTGEGMAAETGR